MKTPKEKVKINKTSVDTLEQSTLSFIEWLNIHEEMKLKTVFVALSFYYGHLQREEYRSELKTSIPKMRNPPTPPPLKNNNFNCLEENIKGSSFKCKKSCGKCNSNI